MSDQSYHQAVAGSSPGTGNSPLPVTLVPGMTVVPLEGAAVGTVVGITQAYCVYRLVGTDGLQVSSWRDLALANICPAAPLLPNEVRENDHRNASATVLRELLALGRVSSLTPEQRAVVEGLLGYLCDQ
jgi:hypothetical protein